MEHISSDQRIGMMIADMRNFSDRLGKAESDIKSIDNRVTQIFIEIRDVKNHTQSLDCKMASHIGTLRSDIQELAETMKQVVPAIDSVKQMKFIVRVGWLILALLGGALGVEKISDFQGIF